MSDLLAFVLSGLVSGALYALLATGLVLSYSASGLFNFAHGATAYLCALAFYELHSGLGWPAVPTALLLVCVASPLLGWGLDRLMFRKLARVGETAQIVATIGLLVALPALGLWVVELLDDAGVSVKPAENQFGLPGVGPSPAKNWQLMDGVGIDSDQLITWVATATVALGLWILMRHTTLGLRLRAAVDNRSLVELRGMSADRLSTVAWMLSSGLAGLAGVLATPLLGLSAHDFTLFLFVSATAAVLGRFASVPLAFAGGLGLGVLQNLVAGYSSFAERVTGFRTAVPFLILFAGLLLLTRRQRMAGTAAADAPPVDYLAGRPWARKWGPWAVAAALLAAAFYTVTTPFWSGILAQGLALSLVFVSFTVVTGLGAMVSLAQATFVTGAALVAGLLMSHGWPFIAAALVGTCVAAVLGALVALPALRLGGRTLALATLALAFLADQVLFQMGWLRNGDTGWEIPRPVFGPVDLSDDRAMGVAMVVLCAAAVAALGALRNSPSGRAMLAVRSAPAAAMASGVSVIRTKLLLFTLSAGLAGFGGVMYASYNTRITATDFTAMTGLIWLAVVVAAGVRRPQFAVVAGLVYAIVPHLVADHVTDSVHLPVVLFGLAGLALANDPDGYCAAISVRRHRRRSTKTGAGVTTSEATAQIPALLMAVSTGMIVTRSNTDADLGRSASTQLSQSRTALLVAGSAALVMALLPGMPPLPFLGVGGLLIIASRRVRSQDAAAAAPRRRERRRRPRSRTPTRRSSSGCGCSRSRSCWPSTSSTSWAAHPTTSSGRVKALRHTIAMDLGVVIPPVRTRDSVDLPPSSYAIRVAGVDVARGIAPAGKLLALGESLDALPGEAVIEPVFGLAGKWIPTELRHSAEMTGATLIDRVSVLVTHLSSVVNAHASRLLSREDVRMLTQGVRA